MKVLHLNTFGRYSTGNIAGAILQSLNIFDEKELIYGCDDSDFVFAKKINDKASTFCHVALNRIFGRNGRYSCINTFKIINEIKKFNPDILHLHNLHGYYLNYSMLFRFIKKQNYKVVWTLHDCWAYTGFCAHYDYENCNKWWTECNKCQYIHTKWCKSVFDSSKSEFIHKKKSFLGVKNMVLICPSEWLSSQVHKSFLKDYPILVINNGILLKNFKPTDNKSFDCFIDRKKKIVLAVASCWTERKGYRDVIEISKRLSDEYQIVMVGVNEQQIVELKNEKIITIKNTNNQDQLAELYSLANVFINPTYEEVLGMTNIEAIACGCPIITYNTGGSVECVDKNINGVVVEKGNIEALCEAIMQVDSKGYSREIISNNAKVKYDSNLMVKDYFNIYKIILQNNTKSLDSTKS